MTTFISAEGLLEIPEVFRKADALKPGQRLEIERVGRGEYQVRLALEGGKPKPRLIEILKSCPVKGFFEPMEPRETTDDLRPLNFE